MKKLLIITGLVAGVSISGYSQGAIDAYSLSQPDLKGTARFMGMAGAFGALGGDLSVLSQNPAGIGVYRSSDIGFTLDLDLQNSASMSQGSKFTMDQTKFLLNNIGTVLTLRLPSQACPNLNFGFSYNKAASFNRVYGGNIRTLNNSMSNYIAGIANSAGDNNKPLSEGQLASGSNYDPYNPGYNDYQVPWLAILGYDSYLINPDVNPNTNETRWYGLWQDYMDGSSTNGSGTFYMNESGAVNEFNIAFGGNISNVVYWGMNFDIINFNYNLSSIWGESLSDAMVSGENNTFVRGNADWNLNNIYNASGTGFNYQLGFIVKPVQEFRLGFAFHTPTWYNLTENFLGRVDYNYEDYNNGNKAAGYAVTNDNYPGYNNFGLRTPWKLIASAAGVIGNNFIISFDYEWANYGKMHLSEPNNYGYYDDYWPDFYSAGPVASSSVFLDPNDPYAYENADISSYYKSTNTFRLGLEFKPISALSIRAGYSYVSSPVRQEAKNNDMTIFTAGTMPSYRFDNSTNYVTCGLGYRYKRFYVDLAYVYKHMDSEYHAYTPDPKKEGGAGIPSPQSKISLNNNQVVLSAGFRF